jgi:hypothetical protein
MALLNPADSGYHSSIDSTSLHDRELGLPELEASLVQEGDIVQAKPLELVLTRRAAWCGAFLLFLAFMGVVLGFSVFQPEPTVVVDPSMAPSAVPSMAPTETPLPMLERIQERGRLTCGYVGFAKVNIDLNSTSSYQITIVSIHFRPGLAFPDNPSWSDMGFPVQSDCSCHFRTGFLVQPH